MNPDRLKILVIQGKPYFTDNGPTNILDSTLLDCLFKTLEHSEVGNYVLSRRILEENNIEITDSSLTEIMTRLFKLAKENGIKIIYKRDTRNYFRR